tara:strand:- start:565 stop:894 length:330 start_codon:yes stop_codon:yes gene_type:complete
MAFKMKYKNLREVVDQLRSAVKAHGKQADTIEKHIDSMDNSPMKKYKSDAQRKAIYASKAESAMKKKGLWDNIHAKRKRIKAGSGEKMRKRGDKGAPSAKDLKESQTKK